MRTRCSGACRTIIVLPLNWFLLAAFGLKTLWAWFSHKGKGTTMSHLCLILLQILANLPLKPMFSLSIRQQSRLSFPFCLKKPLGCLAAWSYVKPYSPPNRASTNISPAPPRLLLFRTLAKNSASSYVKYVSKHGDEIHLPRWIRRCSETSGGSTRCAWVPLTSTRLLGYFWVHQLFGGFALSDVMLQKRMLVSYRWFWTEILDLRAQWYCRVWVHLGKLRAASLE